jgi:hypothetical protein
MAIRAHASRQSTGNPRRARGSGAAGRRSRVGRRKLDIKFWLTVALALFAIAQGLATDWKISAIEGVVDRIYAQTTSPHPTQVGPASTPSICPTLSP